MDGIELMASAMHAAQARLDVSAGNLANVSSDGFHKAIARTILTDRGLAVRTNVESAPGPLRRTGRAFDLALAGRGSLYVAGLNGRPIASRGGSFERDASGHLIDDRGRLLLGERGPLRIPPGAEIDPRGFVAADGKSLGRLRMSPHAEVRAGFLEAANVDAVHEMIDVLGAQRAFETAQKTLSAIDEERQKDVDDVARVKS
jgi:flagellar basal body rod protein FlgG